MKILRRALIICIVVLLIPTALLGFLLGTAPGVSLTVSMVNRLASSPSGGVEISGLGGLLFGSVTADRIAVSDADGVWLTVNDVEVDLARTALLTGRIDASRVSVREIDVARQPVPGDQTSSGSGSGGLPRINATVDNIFVQAIALGEPVLGEAARLQLTGSLLLRDNPLDLTGAIDVVRIDGKSGEVSSEWKIAPETNALELKLSAREPGDGLLARVLQIDGLPALDMEVSGDGALDDWQADLAVSLDGQRTVEGTVALSVTQERQSVDGRLRGYLAPLLPTEITPFFAGETQVDLSVERDGERTLRLHRVTARSALVSIDASGHVLPAQNEVDLSADLAFGSEGDRIAFELPDGTTAYVGHTTLTTSLTGTLRSADWSLSGDIASLSDGSRSVTDARLSGRSTAVDFLAASGPFDLNLEVGSLVTGEDRLDDLVGGAVSATVSGAVSESVLTVTAARLSAGQVDADASGRTDLTTGAVELTLRSTIAAIDAPPFNQVLGSEPTVLSGQFIRDDDGGLRFSEVSLESGNLQVQANGSLAPDTLRLEGSANLASLNALSPQLGGSVAATVALSGSPQEPRFSVEAAGRNVTLLEEPLENLALEASGALEAAGPSVDVELTGRYTDQPISVTAVVRTDGDGHPVAETLNVDVPGARASGSLKPDANGILVGAFDVEVTSLAELGPLLLQDGLSGELNGQVVFSERDSAQRIEAQLTSEQLDLGAVQLAGTQVTAAIVDPQNALSVDARVNSDSVAVSGNTLQQLETTLSGTPDAMRFDAGALYEEAPLSVAGVIRSRGGATTVTLDRASGEYASISVALTDTATITVSGGDVRVDGVRLQAGSGTVAVDGVLSESMAFDVTVEALPLSLFENVAPDGLGPAGTADAVATISGTTSDPAVTYTLSLLDVSVEAMRDAQMPSLNVRSDGTFRSGTLTTDVTASGSGLNLTAGGTVEVTDTQSLNVAVNGTAPVALIEPFAPQGLTPAGSIAIKADVSGTVEAPIVDYDIRLSQLSATLASGGRLPTMAVASKGNFTGGVLTASATASGSGLDMTASGSVDVTDTPVLDIAVNGTAPVSLLEAAAPGGDFAPTGSMRLDAKISGSVTDPTASYDLRVSGVTVAASREAQIPAISLVSTGTLRSGVLETSATATGGGMNLTAGGTVDLGKGPDLDLSINGTAPFEFAAVPLSSAGILLEGGVSIALTARGSAAAPQLSGRLSTSNATFIESNSALTIRDIVGQIDFSGTRAQVTRLEGRVGSSGQLSVSGFIDVDPAKGLPTDLTVTVTDGTYVFGEIISTQYDADLSVNGPLLRTGAIGGTVTLQRTDISIPEKLPSSIPLIDVGHVNASSAILEQAAEIAPQNPDSSDSDEGGLQLDLTVNAPNRIFFRGRGIDAEFGGSLQVQGAAANPRASGTFSMRRGRLDLLSRRFNFDRGTIVFAGPMDPSLDFQTTTTVSGTSYSILVQGTASDPDISFSSSPSMPQDEILANLFFNRNLSRLSPLQIAQLASAVSQLSGASSGDGLFGQLRNLTGLADINLVSEDEGDDTALGIGSYLNDRTYINIEKGLSGGRDRVTIEMDLTDNLKLRGEADSDGESRAGVFFERDY